MAMKTFRLDQEQLDRLSKTLLYLGVTTETDVVKFALNHLENVLQGQFSENLIGALSLIKENNKQLKGFKQSIRELKRNTKI